MKKTISTFDPSGRKPNAGMRLDANHYDPSKYFLVLHELSKAQSTMLLTYCAPALVMYCRQAYMRRRLR